MCFWFTEALKLKCPGVLLMRSISVSVCTVLIVIIAFASRADVSVAPVPNQGPDVSRLVPSDISFATPLVQSLSDSGWSIQAVRHSKFNGGVLWTTKAALVKTDKGILEVAFYDKVAEVEQVQIREEPDSTPTEHKYTVTRANESHLFGGRFPVYFTKYRTMLIVTYDGKLNEAIKRFVADQIRSGSGRT